MREIKFRTWDKEQKRMYSCDKTHILFNKNGNHDLGDEVELMQFTGLYDKNGKEIYEGDILNFDDEYWVVSFEDGKFIGTFDNVIYDIYEISHYEVVGNIYENSDLLGE